ncbi:hypothetical protein SAMN05660462_00796 [Proteiniborus ethanoligenes]|uniref:DUF454 domain-containing protein n=1 Tax=Proteiniborus ethanoligenes TaxID=415015 RepID=A0A1H3MCP2_9FIRM|nr:YbaN family protein [Proteiniborus ethanoligenes]SDY74471.1 hypothetical protein SAMN05660462_00796 [Proteiniborus ethanoligenes]
MNIYKLLFITLGIISMGVGMIGVVLPILPTTPFLILASVFFVKGSDSFDIWFRGTKIYKNYAEDFINDRSMTLKRKITLMMISDFMLMFPLVMIDNIYARLFIITVVIFKYYYFIFRIKTKKE